MHARFLAGLFLLTLSAAPLFAQTETNATALIYARVTGYVEKIHVTPGAAVKKGDLLFELDAAMLRAELAQVSAEIAVAEAMIQRHATDLERAKRLIEIKAMSREEFDKITADRAIAQANLNVVRARLEMAKLRLDFTKIRAPIDGTLQRRLPGVGSLVKADETLLCEIGQGEAKASAKIRELQKERHATLAKVYEATWMRFLRGGVQPLTVLEVHRTLVDAAFELCETPAERIELFRKDVKIVEEVFKTIEARLKTGIASEVDVLQVRAAVLEARIRLQREEDKTGRQKHP